MRFDEDDERQEPFYKKPSRGESAPDPQVRQAVPDGEPELFLRRPEERAGGSDEPSWDVPKPPERGGLLYDPLEERKETRAAAPEPTPPSPPPSAPAASRSGRTALFLLAAVSLAVILGLIGLYSVTSEFQPGRSGRFSSQEPVAAAPPEAPAPAPVIEEGDPEDLAAAEPEIFEEEPIGDEAGPATAPPAETTLVQEISLGEPEPPPPTRIAPPASARRPAPPVPSPSPQPEEKGTQQAEIDPGPPAPQPAREEREEREEKMARKVPAYRPPVVREGGVRPGPGVSPPIPLEIPRFRYPEAARGQGLEVIVRVDLLVDERGRVLEAVVSEGDDSNLGFNEAALTAARKVRFQPATRGDTPVRMWTEMMFEFSEPGAAR